MPIPTFFPREQMKPDEPCWCMSGKEWAQCHADREKQARPNFFQQLGGIRESLAHGFCAHPEAGSATCGAIIKAHTIQKARGLQATAEDQHVIAFNSGYDRLPKTGGMLDPPKLGINTASTFPGFCEKHDGDMFRPVEHGTVQLNRETAFLLSFRALALERFNKLAMLQSIDVLRELDRGLPFPQQVRMQQLVQAEFWGHQVAIADLDAAKARYDQAFRDRNFDRFHFYVIAFDQVLPVVACGAFFPEFDFSKGRLQNLDATGPLEMVTYNLTVLDDRSVAVLGWSAAATQVAPAFVGSFAGLPLDMKANAAIRLAFEHFENTFVRPSWWASLPDQERRKVLRNANDGYPTADRMPRSDRLADITQLIRCNVERELPLT
jgi:hypothetical protein